MYQLKYVCRRCNAHFGSDSMRQYELWNEAEAICFSSHNGPPQHIPHHCADEEGMGFGDLVGFCRTAVLIDYGKEFVYAVAERDGISGSKSYRMHDGPTPDLKTLMVNGISGSNNNFRILKMDKNGNNDSMTEIYRWDHFHGLWRKT